MEEGTTGSSWIFELPKWHNKILAPLNSCCLRESASVDNDSRGKDSQAPIASASSSITSTTTDNSDLAAYSLQARTSLTSPELPNEEHGSEKAIETTRTRALQRRQSTCGSHYRVSITKSLAIGAVAVALLILAQQILKFPVQAACEKQGLRVGTTSFAPAINSESGLVDINVNNMEFATNYMEKGIGGKTSACGCLGKASLDGDYISDDADGEEIVDSAIRSSRDVEQHQSSGNHLQRLFSGESSAGGESSFQRVGRGYLNFRKPTNPSSYKVLNIVSDPSIDIVPTTQGDLNKVSAVYSSDFTGSAKSINNNNNNRLESRKNNSQNSQLISLAGPSNPDETITIDKIKGIDWSLRSIMAKKEQNLAGLKDSGRNSRSSSDDIECTTNKYDRIIAKKLSTNSLSRPIVKSDGSFDNPFPTWRSVGPLDLMKFVVTESDESGIPKNKEELDKELPILKPNFEVDPARKKKFRVTWIGHATTLIQIDGLNILTDPIFSDRASPIQLFGPRRYRDPACTVSELPRIDIVLISHNHYDHLDTNTVRQLNDRFGNNCRWIVPLGVGEFLQSMSLNNYVELDWWQKDCFLVDSNRLSESKSPNNESSISSLSLPQNTTTKTTTDTTNSKRTSQSTARSQKQENQTSNRMSSTKAKELDIYLTPNQHWSRRGVNDVCKTLWGSYVIVSSDDSAFFFAGDTGYCSVFEEINSVFGSMKGAAIPIGAYQPRWFMKYSHVDPHEAVQIHRDLKCAKSIAIHHSTFALANEYYKEPPRLLREIITGLNETVTPFIALKHGETTDF